MKSYTAAVVSILAFGVSVVLMGPARATSGIWLWDRDLFLATSAVSPMKTDRCAACLASEGLAQRPLLQPVLYFRDPKTIVTVPRTKEAAGDLAGVGKLQVAPGMTDGGYGTSFAVSPCHVLTSFHVAFQMDLKHPSRAAVSQFYYGQGRDDSFEGHTKATPIAWGDWHGTEKDGTPRNDWALLVLADCVGAKLGYLDLRAYQDRELFSIDANIAGLLRENYHRGLDLDLRCQIFGYGTDAAYAMDTSILKHRCAVTHGASGAPLYTTTRGYPEVFAISSTTSRVADDKMEQIQSDSDYMNAATTIESIRDPLAKAMLSAEVVDYIAAKTGERGWRPNAPARHPPQGISSAQ